MLLLEIANFVASIWNINYFPKLVIVGAGYLAFFHLAKIGNTDFPVLFVLYKKLPISIYPAISELQHPVKIQVYPF